MPRTSERKRYINELEKIIEGSTFIDAMEEIEWLSSSSNDSEDSETDNDSEFSADDDVNVVIM